MNVGAYKQIYTQKYTDKQNFLVKLYKKQHS